MTAQAGAAAPAAHRRPGVGTMRPGPAAGGRQDSGVTGAIAEIAALLGVVLAIPFVILVVGIPLAALVRLVAWLVRLL